MGHAAELVSVLAVGGQFDSLGFGNHLAIQVEAGGVTLGLLNVLGEVAQGCCDIEWVVDHCNTGDGCAGDESIVFDLGQLVAQDVINAGVASSKGNIDLTSGDVVDGEASEVVLGVCAPCSACVLASQAIGFVLCIDVECAHQCPVVAVD